MPGEILQAEDRVHRIGQTRGVNIHFLHVKGSVDDLMWDMLQSKLLHIGKLLDGKNDRMLVSRAVHSTLVH